MKIIKTNRNIAKHHCLINKLILKKKGLPLDEIFSLRVPLWKHNSIKLRFLKYEIVGAS